MSTPSVRARAESRWGKEATDDALTGDDDAETATGDAGEDDVVGRRPAIDGYDDDAMQQHHASEHPPRPPSPQTVYT